MVKDQYITYVMCVKLEGHCTEGDTNIMVLPWNERRLGKKIRKEPVQYDL